MPDDHQEQLAQKVEEALVPRIHVLNQMAYRPAGHVTAVCGLEVPNTACINAGKWTRSIVQACVTCEECQRLWDQTVNAQNIAAFNRPYR